LYIFITMLRICLDARNIKPVMTGLGRYALNVVRGIAELDSDNEYILLKNPSYKDKIVDKPNFQEVPVAGDTSSVRSFLTTGPVINRLKPDVFHALRHFLPLGVECKRTIVTLHDIMWVEAPDLAFTNKLKALYNKHVKGRFIKHAVAGADLIIAISEATRQRAVEVLKVAPSKCRLIYPGIEERFLNCELSPDNEARGSGLLKLRKCVGEHYIVSLGTSRPYKNVDGTIRAFSLVQQQHPTLKLLIIGRGDRYPALQNLVEELRLGDRVIFWSSLKDAELSDAEIALLFRDARMLAFPSLLEGFGLPIVEAMAAGCPVLTSNISAPREVAGDAAVLVDPHDVNAIAAGMERLLTNEALRQELIARGRRRAAQFTVERCAKLTHALYTTPL
jgi:glycosyltransferase involved in cell wall biosynthesis